MRHVREPTLRCKGVCFNSRTPRGVRLTPLKLRRDGSVSIHAPREGCDASSMLYSTSIYVSIHAPREGCDSLRILTISAKQSFNSRTPGGVRRFHSVVESLKYGGFNSRTPGGVRPAISFDQVARKTVSIHAPREGCDSLQQPAQRVRKVSIHAPREGCDEVGLLECSRDEGFNSRTPGGVRLGAASRPLWVPLVSIHAPREGCDILYNREQHPRRGFNSRTPGGVRHYTPTQLSNHACVSIHAPREGCDDALLPKWGMV